MYPNSLDRKPLLRKTDGNVLRDLTGSIFDFDANNFVTYQAYRIPKEYVMRIDLVAQAVYNNTLYAELILKYNGISNPLSIEADDIILIPGLDSAKKNIKSIADPDGVDVEAQLRKTYRYIDPTKRPRRDNAIAAFDARNLEPLPSIEDEGLLSPFSPRGSGTETANDTVRDGALPPNIAEEGESQITVRNGRVFFGEGIGQSACLKNGMTNSEFLTKVIKSRQPTETPILETAADSRAKKTQEKTDNIVRKNLRRR